MQVWKDKYHEVDAAANPPAESPDAGQNVDELLEQVSALKEAKSRCTSFPRELSKFLRADARNGIYRLEREKIDLKGDIQDSEAQVSRQKTTAVQLTEVQT